CEICASIQSFIFLRKTAKKTGQKKHIRARTRICVRKGDGSDAPDTGKRHAINPKTEIMKG
ncbi:MAG: hypothetical protein IJ060_05025, partial [Oscillospiraceae bacterium]|nr:hypothetical protein [Oscillospiraceae bacterium]